MARDFSLLCGKEFRAREIAVHLNKTHLGIDGDINKRRITLEEARFLLIIIS